MGMSDSFVGNPETSETLYVGRGVGPVGPAVSMGGGAVKTKGVRVVLAGSSVGTPAMSTVRLRMLSGSK